jgi:hypothetical protein
MSRKEVLVWKGMCQKYQAPQLLLILYYTKTMVIKDTKQTTVKQEKKYGII